MRLKIFATLPEMAGGFTRVLLLIQDRCGFCAQAQDILNRLTGEYHLSISTLDMQSPEGQKLALQGGFLFSPGVLIEDDLSRMSASQSENSDVIWESG